MFQHILVPLDGSPRAERALPVAARIARFTGGSLLLVQVVVSPLDYDGGMSPGLMMSQQIIDDEMASSTAYLQSLAKSPELAGITIRTEVLFGQPVQHLLAFVEAPGIDFVVLCSHGRTGFMSWVLGSVAHALVHQSTRPILVLRQGETSSSPSLMDSSGPLRTLIPLDGSPLAETALRPAAYLTAALAVPGKGELHLSQVVKISQTDADERFVSGLSEERLQHARIYLNQTEEHLSSEERDLRLSLTHSVELAPDVASALLALSERGEAGEMSGSNPCDLIAISTHGRGGLERWVMGSVTERLLNTTKLPMLIVRPAREG